MTKVLIADACKPSLVMSSEVFKDKIPGAIVFVANTGKDMLAMVETEKPDICLVDFDLPDVDGATLVVALRRIYKGPILMTAFPDAIVNEAVSALLFYYNDASAWVSKPIKFDVLSEKIDAFLIDGQRLGKRFSLELDSQLIAKAAGRGKRAPKVTGKVVNLSMGGACVRINGPVKVEKTQELTLSIAFPVKGKQPEAPVIVAKPTKGKVAKPTRKGAATAPMKAPKIKTTEAKFRATIAWIKPDGSVGLQFGKLSDAQRKGLETYLRSAQPGVGFTL